MRCFDRVRLTSFEKNVFASDGLCGHLRCGEIDIAYNKLISMAHATKHVQELRREYRVDILEQPAARRKKQGEAKHTKDQPHGYDL